MLDITEFYSISATTIVVLVSAAFAIVNFLSKTLIEDSAKLCNFAEKVKADAMSHKANMDKKYYPFLDLTIDKMNRVIINIINYKVKHTEEKILFVLVMVSSISMLLVSIHGLWGWEWIDLQLIFVLNIFCLVVLITVLCTFAKMFILKNRKLAKFDRQLFVEVGSDRKIYETIF